MKERLLLFVLLGTGIFACSPKYTASFGPSRNFYSAEENNLAAVSEVEESAESVKLDVTERKKEPSAEGLIASTSTRVALVEESNKADQIVKKYTEKRLPSTKEILKMPLKEKKRFLKEVKKDIKTIKKAKKNQSIDNKKIYVGIIIALAGLVIAILASGPIGALGIIVGVVLIAWGLIEQGGI